MSKRIACLILALIMLVGMVPAGVITANAASNRTVSENAVKFIKEWEGFKKNAYWDNTQYSYGYGTKAPDGLATITQTEADKALRAELKEINAKVNQFAAAHNRNFSQSQHDALVSFSYNVGWGWMSQPNYRITKAVINGATGNDFLQAMTLWSNVDSIPQVGLVSRRMAEADMYLNGSYSKTARASYTYVKFDANGGVLGEDKVQAYDYNSPVTITSVPTREGHTFLGWYLTTGNDASWIGVLNKNVAGKTLYARWQSDDAVVEAGKVVGTPADYTISGLNFASNQVYAVPNANNASVKTINQADTFKVTAEYIDINKDKWLKIESGWVKLGEIKVTASSSGVVNVTVTNDYINVRKEPNTDPTNAPIGTVKFGDKLTITAVQEVKGAMWGKFDRGWVALMYTNYSNATSGETGNGSAAKIADGTVLTNATNLNVRTGAGLDYGIVGNLARDTKVEIFEIVTVNGHGWGRIGAGKWVCLDYVNYKRVPTTNTQVDVSNGPATAAEPYKFKATVNVDGLNIYSDPTVSLANPIGSLNKNDNVNILDMTAVNSKVFGKIISKNIAGWIQLDHTTYTASGVISMESSEKLNVRTSPNATDDSNISGQLKNGTAVTILEIRGRNNSNGVDDQLWGRVKEGWIDLGYVKLNTTKPTIVTGSQMNSTTTTTTTAKVIYTGIVNSGINLNVRLGAGVNYDVVHSLANGTEVKVYDKAVVNGHYWGKLGENAWICLTYVTETTNNAGENGSTTDGITNSTTNTTGGANAQPEMATVFNCTTGVNIRSTPSVSGALLGSAALNSRVKVLETTVYNGSKWARTEAGWISMLYLKLDSEVSYSGNSSVNVNGLFQATVLTNKLDVYDALESTGTVVTSLTKGQTAYVTEVQSQNGTTVSGKVTVNGKTGWIDLGSTSFTAHGQVRTNNGDELNVRSAPTASVENVVKQLSNGTSVALVGITAERVSEKTILWGKISLTEWVNLDYINLVASSAGTTNSGNTGLGKVAYTDTLTVRKAAGVTNDVVTTLSRGTEVVIYEETVVDEAVWCRISTSSVNGWVAKDYIDVIYALNNGTTTTPEATTPTEPTVQTSNYATGIVNSNIPLQIRQTADVNSPSVGQLQKGVTITIYEQTRAGGMDWGRIDKGWVSLSYVTMTSTGSTGAGDMGTIIKAFSKVNVRSDTSTNSAIVGEIMVGSRVEVLDQKSVNGYTWYRINSGWVAGEYVELDKPFVGNQTTNNTTDPSAPVTGPNDEVGNMSTTAILQPRVDDVVKFYKLETNGDLVENGTKLVKGETVVITALKGFGLDVWANTKYGWFNLTNDSINFVAVGKVNTVNDNYLMVRGEAGKTSTEPVDKIRDQASITLTGVCVNNGKLWGKTAKGWVDLTEVELTCVKDMANGGTLTTEVKNIASIYQTPSNKLILAWPKDQHLSINVYNAVDGHTVGIIEGKNNGAANTFWIKEIKASGSEVWGAVQTSEGDYWVKLSDVNYSIEACAVSVDCNATSSAGGSNVLGTFKRGDSIQIGTLETLGGKIYGQVISSVNTASWVDIMNLNKWYVAPPAPQSVETLSATGSKVIFKTTMKWDAPLYEEMLGTSAQKGTAKTGETVLVTDVQFYGGELWAKVCTKITDPDMKVTASSRYVKLANLNAYITTASATTNVTVRSSTHEIDTNRIETCTQGSTVTVTEIVADGGSNLWAKIDKKDADGNAIAAYIKCDYLIFNSYNY